MQIQRTVRNITHQAAKPAPQPKAQEQSPDSFSKDDFYSAASGVAGGALGGAGGAYLGLAAGVEIGMRVAGGAAAEGPPVLSLIKILAALPVAMAYGVVGTAVGGSIGIVGGAMAGTAIHDKLSQ